VFDEIATGVAAVEAELAKAAGTDRTKRAPRPPKELGAHLERVEIVIEPEVPPGCEGLEKVLIGENVSERLDVTPAKFRVIVTRRPKYAYRNRDGVVAPPLRAGFPSAVNLPQIELQRGHSEAIGRPPSASTSGLS
jgi:transposase